MKRGKGSYVVVLYEGEYFHGPTTGNTPSPEECDYG